MRVVLRPGLHVRVRVGRVRIEDVRRASHLLLRGLGRELLRCGRLLGLRLLLRLGLLLGLRLGLSLGLLELLLLLSLLL